MPAPSGVVTLTTDFGLSDSYVAQLHAVILRAAPRARIVDLTHDVPPGQAESALFLTETAWPQFGPGAVHVVVVDPGVGTSRRLVAIETAASYLVGPDTGVLSSGVPAAMRPGQTRQVAVESGVRAVEITESPRRADVVASTFHGRDIMAPVAAALATGGRLDELGEPLDRIVVAPALAALGDEGRVIHIDRFGNAITNLRAAGREPVRLIATTGWRDDVTVEESAESYGLARPGRPVLVAGSSGYLEIAWPQDDAAERLGLRVGDAVRLLPRRGSTARQVP